MGSRGRLTTALVCGSVAHGALVGLPEHVVLCTIALAITAFTMTILFLAEDQ